MKLLNVLTSKLKEVLYAVLPITLIVLILNFTLVPLETHILIRFLIGAVFIIVGLTIFLVGVDVGVHPIGSIMGTTLAKSNKVWIVAISSLLLGFFISIAEPDLHILADQVDFVTSGVISKLSIVAIVSLGIGIMLSIGLLRIMFNIPLYKVLFYFYALIFVLSQFTSSEFLAISFDASGATTGAMTVPFILALALGVSSLRRDGKASEKDSFGLVAVASAGAIIAVLVMSIINPLDKITASLETDIAADTSVFGPFLYQLPKMTGEIILALVPIVFIFLVLHFLSLKLPNKSLDRILKGVFYTFVGLVLFLTGVNAGFMDVGRILGYGLAGLDQPWIVVLIGFILGLVVILAEPAVYVLTTQIETVTSGYVKKRVILVSLSIGVAAAVGLSMLRILVPQMQLWHFLLPGYLACCIMMFFAPKLFVGIAFDAGGVASGPMTATFILAFAQGAAERIEHANVLIDGFGIIAMVAMTPIITLLLLGFIFRRKSVKGGHKPDGKQLLPKGN